MVAIWSLWKVNGELGFYAKNILNTNYVAFTEPDPDGVIRRLGLGRSADDKAALTGALRVVWQDADLRRALGDAGHAYLADHHDAEHVVALLEAELTKLAQRPAPARANEN